MVKRQVSDQWDLWVPSLVYMNAEFSERLFLKGKWTNEQQSRKKASVGFWPLMDTHKYTYKSNIM